MKRRLSSSVINNEDNKLKYSDIQRLIFNNNIYYVHKHILTTSNYFKVLFNNNKFSKPKLQLETDTNINFDIVIDCLTTAYFGVNKPDIFCNLTFEDFYYNFMFIFDYLDLEDNNNIFKTEIIESYICNNYNKIKLQNILESNFDKKYKFILVKNWLELNNKINVHYYFGNYKPFVFFTGYNNCIKYNDSNEMFTNFLKQYDINFNRLTFTYKQIENKIDSYNVKLIIDDNIIINKTINNDYNFAHDLINYVLKKYDFIY